jgi:hypothetical protein
MARNVFLVVWTVAFALSCGSEDRKQEPECALFPDSCPEALQCYEGDPKPALTVCMKPGERQRGESCDEKADEVASFCGRELLCVAYGVHGEDKRCTPLCNVDEDCVGEGVVARCITGDLEARRFCLLIR